MSPKRNVSMMQKFKFSLLMLAAISVSQWGGNPAQAASITDRSLNTYAPDIGAKEKVIANLSPLVAIHDLGWTKVFCPATYACKIYSVGLQIQFLRSLNSDKYSDVEVKASLQKAGKEIQFVTFPFAASKSGTFFLPTFQLKTPIDMSDGGEVTIVYSASAIRPWNTQGIKWPTVTGFSPSYSYGGYFGVAQENPLAPTVSIAKGSSAVNPVSMTISSKNRELGSNGLAASFPSLEFKSFDNWLYRVKTDVNPATRKRETTNELLSGFPIRFPLGENLTGATVISLKDRKEMVVGSNYLSIFKAVDWEGKTSKETRSNVNIGSIAAPQLSIPQYQSPYTYKMTVVAPAYYTATSISVGNSFYGYIASILNSNGEEIASQKIKASPSVIDASNILKAVSSIHTLNIGELAPGQYTVQFCSLSVNLSLGDCASTRISKMQEYVDNTRLQFLMQPSSDKIASPYSVKATVTSDFNSLSFVIGAPFKFENDPMKILTSNDLNGYLVFIVDSNGNVKLVRELVNSVPSTSRLVYSSSTNTYIRVLDRLAYALNAVSLTNISNGAYAARVCSSGYAGLGSCFRDISFVIARPLFK